MSRATLDWLFAAGFLALAAGIGLARASPATTYEASVYAGTPTAVWPAFALALAIAVATSLACRGRRQAIGVGLGATAVTAIVSLPVIRGYHFYGMGDALSHLGWTRDIVEGEMAAHELFYPAIHSLGSIFHLLGGVSVERGLLFALVVVFVPFLAFVPLVVRDLSGSALAVGAAAVVSWMVLPINNVATHMGVHTNSNALFLVPVVVFAVVAYLRRRATVERLPLGLSPFSVLVYLSGIALLLVHPQQMVNAVVFVAAVSGVQYLVRRRYADHPLLEQPTVYTQTVVLGAIFVVWAATNRRFREAAEGFVAGIFAADVGAGGEIDQQGSSLTEIGGSLSELFVTMFLDAAVIGLVVGLFVLLAVIGRTSLDEEGRSLVTYFAAALVPLGAMFLLYFLGTPNMAFRQMGFIYVLLTILAGVAIAHGVGGCSRLVPRSAATALAAAVLGACLVLGLMTVYASPIIYSPGQHVSEATFNGYETGMDRGVEDRPYAGVGYDPYRFDHGINGLEGEDSLTGGTAASGEVDADAFNAGDYAGAYGGADHYLAVTAFDETREFDVYRGIRYDEADYRGLESDPSADRVVSNDDFRMYDVSGEE
ncbi:hypothetical protein [Natronococcus jeotgali]|uniref:Glycosyltransferase RgtA/B/C/D-like domain-containing protein n=1 Tax=Natronococcus jeotgali DSM 18795 TaxID=1227498 RepID=L9WZ98_9EURY|nr:hypothetical protein [Natronococcus jeotgali]ELY54800.1 hypothetical protein C492_16316 [Natronococcus jeotgali DSM 18795]